jgi:hypothetical protein
MPPPVTRRSGPAQTGLPQWIRPQLTQLVDAAPEGEHWLHEIKFDGYRMQARLDRGAVRLLTRTGCCSFLGGAFLTSARIRRMISLARLPSLMMRPRACRTSSRSGRSAPSQRHAALAFVSAAAIGWLTSWAIEAAS